MRTAIKATDVFHFDELDEGAKQTARDWYREGNLDHEWWDCIYDDFDRIAAILGIEVSEKYFSGFASQGDGASFFGSYSYRKGAVKELREYAPLDEELLRIGLELQTLQARVFYQANATIDRAYGGGNYVHECTMSVDVETNDGREWSQDTYTVTQDGIQASMRHLAQWLYSRLEKEYDWQNSDETVDENIKANEYEFTEDGEVY